jgi:hypothetical protein
VIYLACRDVSPNRRRVTVTLAEIGLLYVT